jgi:hypothetical protein
LFYILSSSWLKIAVGFFLLRVAIKRTHIWIIRFTMAGTTLFGATYFLLAIFQCKPISAWWKQTPGYGTCLGPEIVLATSYTSATLNSIADWTFGILPYFIVKDLDLPHKQKWLVAIILGFAAIGSIATIIRIPFVMSLTQTDDFLYATVDIAIWSTVEPGVGIAAACAATFRPLIQPILRGRPGWWSKSSYTGYSSRRSSRRRGVKNSQISRSYAFSHSHSLPTLRPDYVGNYTEITSAGDKAYNSGRESKEPLRPTLSATYPSNKELPFNSSTSTIKELTSTSSSDEEPLTALPIWHENQKSVKLPKKPTQIYAGHDHRGFRGLAGQGHDRNGGEGIEMGITKRVEVTFWEEIDPDGLETSLEDAIWCEDFGKKGLERREKGFR